MRETITILDYDTDKEKFDSKKITTFYNEIFPKTPHLETFKINKWEKPDSETFMAMDGDKIVGLLESWKSNGKRVLATAAVAEGYREQGVFKTMFEVFKNKIHGEQIVVHFRDSKKETLEKVYTSLGFSNLKEAGKYKNNEIKWEMTYNNREADNVE